jgi:capsular exopolysaccharide synthesis family protein
MRDENIVSKEIIRKDDDRVVSFEAPYLVSSLRNPSRFSDKKRVQANFDPKEILRMLHSQWRFAALCGAVILAVVAAGIVIAYKKYPSYEADVRIQIDPPGSETFSLAEMTSSPVDLDYVDTQAQVLKSDELAIDAIRGLRLDQNPEIVGTKPCDRTGGSADGFQLSECESIALRHLQDTVSVTPIKNTRVLELKFASRDPRLAPTVANTLVTLFVERNYKTRYDAVMKSSQWLERQLEDVHQKMIESSQALANYERGHGIVDVDDKQSTVTQNISELNHQLTQSQADRIQLQPYVAGLQSGDADALPQVRDNAMIQALTQRSIEVQSELSEAKAVYGSQSPNVKKLENQASALQQEIGLQKQQIVREMRNNYSAAQSRERLVSDQLAKVTGQMSTIAEYNNLKRDALANSDLYNTLYARIKEAGIAAASKSSNVRVFDAARVLDRPTWPKPMPSLLIGFVVSLFGAVAAAFVKGSFDTTLHYPGEVATLTGTAVALVPHLESAGSDRGNVLGWIGWGRKSLPADTGLSAVRMFSQDSCSPVAEAIRSLQTTIMFHRRNKPLRVILVASPFAGEGKTTIAINLAVALASSGRTCLVDADLRKSRIASSFNLEATTGLSDILRSKVPTTSPLVGVPDLPMLAIMPGGPRVSNPASLILSKQMAEVINGLRKSCDYVIIDSPPLIPFADARALAPLVDGMILVSRSGSTTREAVLRCMEVLAGVEAPIVSVVLNGVNINLPDYQYYH